MYVIVVMLPILLCIIFLSIAVSMFGVYQLSMQICICEEVQCIIGCYYVFVAVTVHVLEIIGVRK